MNKEEIENINRKLETTEDDTVTINLLYQKVEFLESILDKVTDYIKKDIKENILSEKCNEDGMEDYWRGCIDTEAEILNIIEGEKK